MRRPPIIASPLPKPDTNLGKDYDTLSSDQVFQVTVSILQKKNYLRTSLDHDILFKAFSCMPTFQKLTEEEEIEPLKTSCQYFTYEKRPQNSTLFKKNDYADAFYVLLKGKVNLQIPEKQGNKITVTEVKEVKEGNSFGEFELIDTRLRSVTAVCKEECHFAVLSKDHYLATLGEVDGKRLDAKVDTMAAFPIFNIAGKKTLFGLSQYFEVEETPLNMTLYKEGDPANYVYFVAKGKYKILGTVQAEQQENLEGVDLPLGNRFNKKSVSRNIEVAVLGENEILGIEDVILKRKRKSKAICVLPGIVYKITAEDFRRRVLVNEAFKNLAENYVNSREAWYQVRVAKMEKQILQNKDMYISATSLQKRESRNKIVANDSRNSLDSNRKSTTQIPQSSSKMKSITNLSTQNTLTIEKSDKQPSSGIYVTSLSNIDVTDIDSKTFLKQNESSKPFSSELLSRNSLSNKKAPSSAKRPSRYYVSVNTSLNDISEFQHDQKPTSLHEGMGIDEKKPPSKTSISSASQDRRKRNQSQIQQLFTQGIFESHNTSQNDVSIINTQKQSQPPSARRGSEVLTSAQRYITIKPPRPKDRRFIDVENYITEKEKILERLDGKVKNEHWELQSHLAKVMQENKDLSRKLIAMKKSNITAPPRKSAGRHRASKSFIGESVINHLSDLVEKFGEKHIEESCVNYHLPRKYISSGNSQRPKSRPMSCLNSPKSLVLDVKEPPAVGVAGGVNTSLLLNPKIGEGKASFMLLNRRLKRKFVKSHIDRMQEYMEAL